MNTLSYARISQASEKFDKVREQLDQARAYAVSDGWAEPVEYYDNDTSASKGLKRSGFDDMLEAVESGAYDVLIVKEQSRLERDVIDLRKLDIALAVTGTKVYSLLEGPLTLGTEWTA